MKARLTLLPMAALALITALSTCTANGGSIYATIETEKKISVSTLDQYLTIIDLVNVGAVSPALPYFAAAGAVYNGTLPDLNNNIGWPNVGGTPGAVTPPSTGALCTALTYFPFNGNLYGGFFSSDGSTAGLYTSPAVNPSFSTPITDPLVAGNQITFLQTSPADPAHNLFAVVAKNGSGTSGFTYELDYSTNGTNFFTATSPALVPMTGLPKITGVAYFPANATFYVTSGSTLYAGAAPTSLSLVAIPNSNGEQLQGVTADGSYIFIPSSSGSVYYYNGTTWFKASTNDQVSGNTVGFLTVSTHVDTSGPGAIYLVGADGLGFYTLNVGNNTLSRFSDVTVTGLYAGAVRRILVDQPHSNTVFFGTAGTGLWRATFDPALGTVNSSWIHE